MTKKEFFGCFDKCKELGKGIAVFVDIPGNKHHECITNNVEDLDSKKEYYDWTYDENMNHKHAPEVKIVGAMPFDTESTPKEEVKTTHIERMKNELRELYDKYLKASFFLNEETTKPKFTDEVQRSMLNIQVNTMFTYITALEQRIKYDVKKDSK